MNTGLKISSIAADLAKEAEGDWIDIAEWAGVRLLVRSIHNKLFQNAREQRIAKLTKELGRLPFQSEMEPHIAKFATSFLLLGWDGICGDDDTPIPYSTSKAIELMTDPAMRSLVEQVIWAATRVGSRDAEFVTANAKNCAAPSATS